MGHSLQTVKKDNLTVAPRIVLLLSAIIFVSFAVKISIAWITRDTVSYFDEWDYYERAVGILEDPNCNEIYRPPGYVSFLTAIFWLFGKNLFAVKAAQVVISTLSVLLAFKVAADIFDQKVGMLAAGIFAFYPELIAYSHYLWRETIYIFYLLALFYILTLASSEYRRYRIVLAGIACGTCAMIRASLADILPICVLCFYLIKKSWRQFIIIILLFLFGVIFVIAPWTIRNYQVTDRFLLISTELGYAVWRGLNVLIDYGNDYRVYELFDEPGFYEWDDIIFPGVKDGRKINWPEGAEPNPVDSYRETIRRARAFALKNPCVVLRRMWPKFCILWGPNSFVIRHLRLGIYGKNFTAGKLPIRVYPTPKPALTCTIILIVVLSYCFVLVTGLLGMIFHNMNKKSLLLVSFIIINALIFSILTGVSRYRLQLMPFIIIFSAYAICHAREIISAPDMRIRWSFFFLLLGIFVTICVRYSPIIFDIFLH